MICIPVWLALAFIAFGAGIAAIICALVYGSGYNEGQEAGRREC